MRGQPGCLQFRRDITKARAVREGLGEAGLQDKEDVDKLRDGWEETPGLGSASARVLRRKSMPWV